jgi:uncharacterized paraquat-inducible protein A
MAKKEYIERGAVLALKQKIGAYGMDICSAEVKEIPAADVVEVVHGEWIDRDGKTWCSNCDASNKQYKPPYCPHCGAKMDGGKTE